ncbi:hypothetical protein BSPP4475_01860 [Brevibacillus aydinogluensis]|uniref:Uncharacterized protein n=1 Tax=Brevibacillus aydinogluensis TaxID=927786 RepID=A0AA48M7I5_9BACL|nr:hypothetical protein BSPP4475_01860 [Brevibacillus aydinogluensis]
MLQSCKQLNLVCCLIYCFNSSSFLIFGNAVRIHFNNEGLDICKSFQFPIICCSLNGLNISRDVFFINICKTSSIQCSQGLYFITGLCSSHNVIKMFDCIKIVLNSVNCPYTFRISSQRSYKVERSTCFTFCKVLRNYSYNVTFVIFHLNCYISFCLSECFKFDFHTILGNSTKPTRNSHFPGWSQNPIDTRSLAIGLSHNIEKAE